MVVDVQRRVRDHQRHPEGLGFIDQPIAWTASPDTALAAVIMVDVWKTTPFMALLILAGLQMLPGECYEAAKVDGVHPCACSGR